MIFSNNLVEKWVKKGKKKGKIKKEKRKKEGREMEIPSLKFQWTFKRNTSGAVVSAQREPAERKKRTNSQNSRADPALLLFYFAQESWMIMNVFKITSPIDRNFHNTGWTSNFTRSYCHAGLEKSCDDHELYRNQSFDRSPFPQHRKKIYFTV